MKTTVIGSGKDIAKTNTTSNDKSAIHPAVPLKDANKTEVKNDEKVKPTVGKPQAEQPKATVPVPKAPKAEPTKVEIKQQLAGTKTILNLEGTLKLVEELHRRKIQRDKLLDTIDTLEEFEVAQKDDAEETDSNHFQRCQLTIEDDQRREFTTKNPFIIKKVAEYINSLCLDRLAEIEGEIQLPI